MFVATMFIKRFGRQLLASSRVKESHGTQICCGSKDGRNSHRTLTEKGVAFLLSLPEEGRPHSLCSDREEKRFTSRRPRDSMSVAFL